MSWNVTFGWWGWDWITTGEQKKHKHKLLNVNGISVIGAERHLDSMNGSEDWFCYRHSASEFGSFLYYCIIDVPNKWQIQLNLNN